MVTEPTPTTARPIGRLFRIAVSAGIDAAVKLHILRGDDLECRDENGFTPLLIAASRNRASVCRLLISAGANVYAIDSAGRDVLTIARECGAFAAVEAIAAYLANHGTGRTQAAKGSQSASGAGLTTSECESLHASPDGKTCSATGALPSHSPNQALRQDSSTETVPAPVAVGSKSSAKVAGDSLPKNITSIERTLNRSGSDDEVSSTIEIATVVGGAVYEVDARQCVEEPAVFLPENSGALANHLSPSGKPNGPISQLGDDSSVDQLTFGDWEAVETLEPPRDNRSVALSAAERQRQIDVHTPIDHSAAWDDFEAFLPESAEPLRNASDRGFGESLRALILRGLREGSVPTVAVEDAFSARGDGDERDLRAEAALGFILGDMGAEQDERLEFQSVIPSENFKVVVDPVETDHEEAEVDGAVLHFEELLSDRNDPFRIYHRVAVKYSLLSSEHETELAQQMEGAVERALDALANWPLGMSHLLGAMRKAIDTSNLSSLIVLRGGDSDEINQDADTDDNDDASTEADLDASLRSSDEQAKESDEDASTAVADAPNELLAGIQALVLQSADGAMSPQLRYELGRLRFRRPFLMGLADVVKGDHHPSASAYKDAIAELIHYRDRMAQANLRLVMDIARRRMHSGLSLEDLIQEGNIGLLKAVDRFDWRRGFRFSTMAIWWIKQQIGRAIFDMALEIRLPVHIHEKVSRARREIESLERTRGNTISLQERAAVSNMTADRFEVAARALSEPLSIDEAQEAGCFESEEVDQSFVRMAIRDDERLVDAMLAKLKKKDAQVLRLRFGIGVPEALTLEQIGEILGVTRERVRQIEAAAVRKLSSPHHRDALSRALGKVPPQRGAQSKEGGVQVAGDAPPESGPAAHSQEPSSTPHLWAEGNVIRQADAIRPSSLDGAASPISAFMQRLLDAARDLGVPVAEDLSGSKASFIFGEIDWRDRKGRKLIRDLLGAGFTWQPGKGYRQ
ncbi:hypothetical protein CFM90_16045 [Ralstonia solanacearum]|nr:hypothetical protein CFM90_16045 [Ralstonia solanacearum]